MFSAAIRNPDLAAARAPRRRRWMPLSLRLLVGLFGLTFVLTGSMIALRSWRIEQLNQCPRSIRANWGIGLRAGELTRMLQGFVGD
jgi:hypothetical protein